MFLKILLRMVMGSAHQQVVCISRMLTLSRRELGLIMKFMGEALTEREIQMIIDEADVDHDGLIDYTEFFSMMNPK